MKYEYHVFHGLQGGRGGGLFGDAPDLEPAEVDLASLGGDLEQTSGGIDRPGAQLLPGARSSALDLGLHDPARDLEVVDLRSAFRGDVQEDLVCPVGN